MHSAPPCKVGFGSSTRIQNPPEDNNERAELTHPRRVLCDWQREGCGLDPVQNQLTHASPVLDDFRNRRPLKLSSHPIILLEMRGTGTKQRLNTFLAQQMFQNILVGRKRRVHICIGKMSMWTLVVVMKVVTHTFVLKVFLIL